MAIDPAHAAVSFVQHLKHTRGKWAGVPFDLLPWQRDEVVRPFFGTVNEAGKRQYRTAYIEVPRKQGKSELGAALALKFLFADEEQGGEVYSAAATRDQASIVFNIGAAMVRASPQLSKRAKIIDSTKRIIVTRGVSAGSFWRAIPSDAAASHGFNASAVIFDEVHVQPNRELWDVLATSQGAREQPAMIGITTAGYDRNSLCWELHEYARQVRDGIIEDPTFLPVLYSADEQDDWLKEETWRKANPSLGITVPLDFFQQEARKAMQSPAWENTFRRLYLNQWTQQESRWIPMHAWDAATEKVLETRLRGRECFGGLDLANTTDIAALVLVFPPSDPGKGDFELICRFWVPKEGVLERTRRDRVPYEAWQKQGLLKITEGNVIDYAVIRHDIEELASQYQISELAFDRWGAVQMSLELQEAGLTMIPFGQGFAQLSSPSKELLRLILEKRVRHGGHPIMRWMADNVMVEQDPAGNVKPSRRRSTEKIDGIVALIMGLDRALRNEVGRRRPVLLGSA